MIATEESRFIAFLFIYYITIKGGINMNVMHLVILGVVIVVIYGILSTPETTSQRVSSIIGTIGIATVTSTLFLPPHRGDNDHDM